MKILLFSTTGILIDHIKSTLSDSGHLLTIASTPADAITMMKIGSPAVVMIDLAAAALPTFVAQFVKHQHAQQARPAIVLFSQTHPDPISTPPIQQLPDELLSLGVHGFGRYSEHDCPPISDILAQLKQPTLAQQHHKTALIARTHKGDERIIIEDILYCQAEQKYTKIHHRHGATLVDDTLKSLLATYPDDLVRIHRHTLVGIRHIHAISDTGELNVCGVATPLTISRRCQADLRLKFAHFYQHSPKKTHLNLPKANYYG